MAYNIKSRQRRGKITYSEEIKGESKLQERFEKIKSPFLLGKNRLGDIVVDWKLGIRRMAIYPLAWVTKIKGNKLEVEQGRADGKTFNQILLTFQKTGYDIKVIS